MMSASEDKSTHNDDDNAVINQDAGSPNAGTITEGNLQLSDSNKNTEFVSPVSKNMAHSASNITIKDTYKGSGDHTEDTLNENLDKSFKNDTPLTGKSLNTDPVTDKGDYTAKTKVSGEADEKSDDDIINMNLVKPKFNSDDIGQKDIKNVEKSDKILLKMGDDLDDDIMDYDDMELRWDDDDVSDPANDNGKSDKVKNFDTLSEEQLLEEPTDLINTEQPEVNAAENTVKPEIDLGDIVTKNNEDERKDNISTEDNLVEETELDEPLQMSPEMHIPIENIEDENNENVIEGELMEEAEKSTETAEIEDLIEKVVGNKDNIVKGKMTEKVVSTEKKAKENEEVILREDNLLEEPENIAENSKANDAEVDNIGLEDKLLEENVTDVKPSDNIPETDISMNIELGKNDDVLENNILGEIETISEITPEANASMTVVDDENEDDLLRYDESDDDSSTAMDIDKTDPNIDNQARIDEKLIDEPTAEQGEIVAENKPTASVDTILEENQTELLLLEEHQATVEEMNTDQPIENQSEIKKTKVNVSIDDQDEIEKKKNDKRIDNEAESEEQNKDQLIEVTNEEQTFNSPTEMDKNTDTEKSTENTTLEKGNEKKSQLKKQLPENITESIHQESLNKNNDTCKILANMSSMSTEDSFEEIKTNHGLHKPDVMLDIPTQELIDFDETDLSLNLDQSEIINSPKDGEKTICEDRINERTVDQDSELSVGKVQTDDSKVVEKSTDSYENIKGLVQETIEESMERMFADNPPAAVKKDAECIATTSQAKAAVQPSTTAYNVMTPDTSEEVSEVSDSLGLLAESSGRMMDDEDNEDDEDNDDDDDFDQDESSNQISAEQSEDSNPPVLDTEPVSNEEGKELETPDKDSQFDFLDNADSNSEDKVEDKMDIDIEEFEVATVELPAETVKDEETKSAVDALLKDGTTEDMKETQKPTDQVVIETVKLSDTSDTETELETKPLEEQSKEGKEEQQEKLKQSPSKQSPNLSPAKQSPSKVKKLEITTPAASEVVNIVDLEISSSSEDDIQEIRKKPVTPSPEEKPPSPDPENVTKINLPTGIEVMCTSGGITSEIVTTEGESVVISGIPKPPPQKPARLNTSEVSIKTASTTEPLVIPETKINDQSQTDTKSKPKLGLEIFSLDSDEDDSAAKEEKPTTSPHKMTALELEKARETSKCINYSCTSGNKVPYRLADSTIMAYYDAGRKRRSMVCQPCADVVANRTKNLIQGIKNLSPLLDLDMDKPSQDLVEISDSESEDEDTSPEEPKDSIGEKGAKFLEENLAELLNETWRIYDMDTRLKETQIMLDDEIEKLEQESKDLNAMLNECQVATDKLRCELYATFEFRRKELPPLVLYDTPDCKYIGPETDSSQPAAESAETRQAKRRLSSSSETPAKRPAIPLGYAPLDAENSGSKEPKATLPGTDNKLDDDKDISVVKLSAESAPADLPPPGEISRPPLRISMSVFAMKNAFGPWLKGKILEIQPKNANNGTPFSLCRVKFDHKAKTNGKILPARCIAYAEPADVRMTIGTRLIALFKDSNKGESYYSGVVAEIPNPVNNYRYLVFFDDGYAQYVQHAFTRVVCESSPLVWEEVHPFSREFVKEYLLAYPERPMVRLHEGQHLKTEWNGKWWSSRILKVDASLAQVLFVGDGRREWIYRGSTRLAPLYLELRAAERHRPRPMPRSKAQPRFNMPYVEYTRSDEQESTKPETQTQQQQQQQQSEEIRRQRAVAKKSTSVPPPAPPPQQQTPGLDTVTSRVVYYTPKNAVKPYKMTSHRCGPKCKRSDVLSLKELRTYNPLAKPLLSGWERQIVRFKGHKEVMYRAPCGRRLRNMRELHHYLRTTDSELPVDLFDFHHATHCLAEFVLNKCLVGKKDLSHGKENVPVPCVNYYDESLPEFCSYNTERTPTAGVPLNLDPEFLCGCDCTDDCQDKSKCACWKMTLEGARTIGLEGNNIGYAYKRLPEPLPSGIYECNSRCKCKHTCLNRVAQHPLQLKLQVFKTLNRGWGIRALNDVPKGSFLCVYAGNLLTDATANLDGLNEGDEYLAELDYIEVVEQMKEGYEEDIPEADKKLDKRDKTKQEEDDEEEEPSSSEDEGAASKTDKEDDDFRPGYIGLEGLEFNKRLRKREKSKRVKEEKAKQKEKERDSNNDDDCITISDDEEVREPSRFTVQAGMGANEFISKYKSVRTLFGRDEACYIMDAKVQGNIGRYLNHSCCPNVFVQNVFVDTHDPRFPWVAFFALSHIKAGTELTWNYNYDVGSVPGKVLYCFCGAPNCRGRLL